MPTERILIVEDDGIAAIGLESTITTLGYESVGIAFTAAEAVEKALHAHPDLILMDIKLKGERDGISAAEEIHRTCDIPVVYLTAFSDFDTLERAKTSAPFGYLLKPYREESIKSTIEIALNAFRLGKEVKESEQDFRALFELSPTAGALVTRDGKITKINTAFAILFGYDDEKDLLGTDFRNLFSPSDREALSLRNESLFALPHQTGSAQFQVVRRSGAKIHVLIQSRVVHEAHSRNEVGLYIISDISAQKEVEEHLRASTEVLLESNQKLQHFTSLASHDLKAPARTTGAFVSLLAREYGAMLDERGREFLGFALAGSKQMQAIIDDLMEYTKACHSPSELKPISLNKVVHDTLAIISPEIAEKRADITYEPLPTILGSERQLRRLFGNLLSNAIKFNRSKPKIRITATETDKDFIISVADNGVGIPATETEGVFEMFHRAHPQSEFPGTGIGLASCKKVVENHHGQIWVKSTIGKGSTFFLSFPIHLEEKLGSPVRSSQESKKGSGVESLH